MIILKNDPKKYYKSLIKTIEDNRNAYREAYKAVENHCLN